MKRYLILVFSLLVLAAVGCSNRAGGSASGSSPDAKNPGVPTVEIAFLNHPPVLWALTDADKLLASYGDRIKVIRYDFDTSEGAAFAKKMKLTGHVPLAIFVNGAMEVSLGGRKVKFYSFPSGSGQFMVPGGTWTVEDLRQAIEAALSKAQ